MRSVSYEWRIPDVSWLTDETVIESPYFTSGDQFNWKLTIKVDGSIDGESEIWLSFKSTDSSAVTFDVDGYFFNICGRKLDNFWAERWDTNQVKWTFNREEFFDITRMFLFDDTLVVKVDVKYFHVDLNTTCSSAGSSGILKKMKNRLVETLWGQSRTWNPVELQAMHCNSKFASPKIKRKLKFRLK
jgi:hypothetical protein